MDEVFRCVNLNVHYSAPEYVWDKIDAVFKSMDFYDPTSNVPSWKGDDFYVEYSLEPSGMQFSSNMSENLWQKWYGELKKRLSDSLGYEIGELEDGFDFFYDWNSGCRNEFSMTAFLSWLCRECNSFFHRA